jgi:MYXO-CTERM domain-containing protein
MLAGSIDGSAEAEDLNAYSLSAGPGVGDSFGSGSPVFDVGSAVANEIELRITFTLTPGDHASFNSTFLVLPGPIPAPGALALMGLAGLVASRRRARG